MKRKDSKKFVAACCSVLQRVAACCSVLQRVAVDLIALQCVKVSGIVRIHFHGIVCFSFPSGSENPVFPDRTQVTGPGSVYVIWAGETYFRMTRSV